MTTTDTATDAAVAKARQERLTEDILKMARARLVQSEVHLRDGAASQWRTKTLALVGEAIESLDQAIDRDDAPIARLYSARHARGQVLEAMTTNRDHVITYYLASPLRDLWRAEDVYRGNYSA